MATGEYPSNLSALSFMRLVNVLSGEVLSVCLSFLGLVPMGLTSIQKHLHRGACPDYLVSIEFPPSSNIGLDY